MVNQTVNYIGEILPYSSRQNNLHSNKSVHIVQESIVKQRLLVSGFLILFQSRLTIWLFSGTFMTLM